MPFVQLNVSVKDVETILGVLGKQPFEQVADLFMNLRQQTMSQLQPQPQPTGDAPAPMPVPMPEVTQ